MAGPSVASGGDAKVTQHGVGHEVIGIAHHQAAGQDAKRSVKDAHVDVQIEYLYTLARKKGCGIGDDGRVGAAQKFFHVTDLRA